MYKYFSQYLEHYYFVEWSSSSSFVVYSLYYDKPPLFHCFILGVRSLDFFQYLPQVLDVIVFELDNAGPR